MISFQGGRQCFLLSSEDVFVDQDGVCPGTTEGPAKAWDLQKWWKGSMVGLKVR